MAKCNEIFPFRFTECLSADSLDGLKVGPVLSPWGLFVSTFLLGQLLQ